MIAVPIAHMTIVIVSRITDKHTDDAMNVAIGAIAKTPNKERIRGGGRTNEQPLSIRVARMCRGGTMPRRLVGGTKPSSRAAPPLTSRPTVLCEDEVKNRSLHVKNRSLAQS